MAVARLIIELHLPWAESLKDRRHFVRSLKDRLRHDFNVSVAEVGEAERWQRAEIAVVAVSGDRRYLEGLLRRAGEAAVEILRGQDVGLGEIEFLD